MTPTTSPARTSADCNENGIPDECEIAAGAADDEDGNGIPDECEMEISGDVNGDGVIDVLDLIEVITSWGPCPGCDRADVDGSGAVDVLDLIAVISAWTV